MRIFLPMAIIKGCKIMMKEDITVSIVFFFLHHKISVWAVLAQDILEAVN